MAIRFQKTGNDLLKDLERRGFRVLFVRHYSNGPGRTDDLCLENGVVVNWDRYSHKLWAEGPADLVYKVENFLRGRYEGGPLSRLNASVIAELRLGEFGFNFRKKFFSLGIVKAVGYWRRLAARSRSSYTYAPKSPRTSHRAAAKSEPLIAPIDAK